MKWRLYFFWFSFSSFIKRSRKYVSELKCPVFGAQNLNWKRIKEMHMAANYSFVHIIHIAIFY